MEIDPDGRARLRQLLSTEPRDFLDPHLQPGTPIPSGALEDPPEDPGGPHGLGRPAAGPTWGGGA